MAIYNIKVIKNGRTLLRKQISKGLLQTDAVHLQAGADQSYVLSDALSENKSPAKLQSRRVGQDLHVALDNSAIAAPDFIIDGYFNFSPGPLLGVLGDGTTAGYDMNQLIALAHGDADVSATTAGGVSVLADPKPYAGFSGLQLVGALGVGALALGAGGGGGGSSGLTASQSTLTSQGRINAFADDGSLPPPVLTDYGVLLVAGVSASNFAAINSAVDAVTSAQVDSLPKLQVLVNAYNKILSEANGLAVDASPNSNPLVSDYAAIGAKIGLAATNSFALSLLNDVVGSLNTSAVDTVAKINALAVVVDNVMLSAVGTPSKFTLEDFASLGLATAGLGAVTSVNLSSVAEAISQAGGQNKLDTLVELQNLVTAVATIVTYASDSTQPAPILAAYSNAGLTGVTSSNLNAINSAIDANTVVGVDTKAHTQAVIDAYNVILAEPKDGVPRTSSFVNPTASQFSAIGADIGAANTHSEGLALLNNSIASLNVVNVDTVGEINALAATVGKVMGLAALATGSVIPTNAPSMAELSALGLNTAFANSPTEQSAIWQGIIDSPDNGSGVMTILQLQAIINTHAT